MTSDAQHPDQSHDAIALLTSEHREVEALFERFRQEADPELKSLLARKACLALKIHTQIEEEILYPALRGRIDDTRIDQAYVEHRSARDLIARIQDSSTVDSLYRAKVQVLSEQIDHHVREEEGELFPDAVAAGLDMAELGARMTVRKAQLARDYRSDLSDERAVAEPRSFVDAEAAACANAAEANADEARAGAGPGPMADLQPDQPGGVRGPADSPRSPPSGEPSRGTP